VIEGPTLVAEAHASGWPLVELYLGPDGVDPCHGAVPVVRLAKGVVEQVATTVTPQPVLALAERRTAAADRLLGDFVLAADGVADPGNLGTILRSAEASGVSAVVLATGTVDPFNPKVVRSSAGSLFRVAISEVVAIDALAHDGRQVHSTSSHAGVPYDEVDWRGPIAIVLGNEAHGVSAAMPGRSVIIPHVGPAESLNVAMAATVLCFEVARQRRHATRHP